MAKYFGTDGIRGDADTLFTNTFCNKVGFALGTLISLKKKDAKVLIGRDTRISGELIRNHLAEGLNSAGVEVYDVGVITTPGVAYLVKEKEFDGAIMISASHNVFSDNGIKIFDHSGMKLNDESEMKLEELIDKTNEIQIGSNKVYPYHEGSNFYIEHLKSIFDLDLKNYNIFLDCANGSTSNYAKELFESFGAKVSAHNLTPNGVNINHNCGSTHLDYSIEKMKGNGYDVGFSFDGDGDRVLCIDQDGNEVNGDKLMYIIGHHLKRKKQLKDDVVVLTPMTNLGAIKQYKKSGLNVSITDVGDRFVLEEMIAHDYSLGGEQSGHIIIKDYGTTGDGLLSALMLLEALKKTGKSLVDETAVIRDFPQSLYNYKTSFKKEILSNDNVLNVVEKVEDILGDDGRVFVRPSGTEPLLRIMIEAKDESLCESCTNMILDVIKEEFEVN